MSRVLISVVAMPSWLTATTMVKAQTATRVTAASNVGVAEAGFGGGAADQLRKRVGREPAE